MDYNYFFSKGSSYLPDPWSCSMVICGSFKAIYLASIHKQSLNWLHCYIDFKSVLTYNLNFFKFNPNDFTRLAKSQKKNSLECVYVNLALKIQCHIVKNTFLHSFFGDFAHWVALNESQSQNNKLMVILFSCFSGLLRISV